MSFATLTLDEVVELYKYQGWKENISISNISSDVVVAFFFQKIDLILKLETICVVLFFEKAVDRFQIFLIKLRHMEGIQVLTGISAKRSALKAWRSILLSM